MTTTTALFDELKRCLDAQEDAVIRWHEKEPASPEEALCGESPDSLAGLVRAQHFMNCSLWHIEDTARRTDVDDAVIADCKRRIDHCNQRRNDFMEKVDEALIRRLSPSLPRLPEGQTPRYNTESMGMAVDRLSILALKIYHMREQAGRSGADEEHRRKSREKLAVLEEQRRDLFRSLLDLIGEFLAGGKQPKVYYQFKMYNDPTLNPEIYTHR